MSTDEVEDIPSAQATEQQRAAAIVPSEETLKRLRTDVYTRTLANCVHNFFGVGFRYPFIAIPCAFAASLLRYGLPPGDVVTFLLTVLVFVCSAAFTGVILGIIATSIGGIVAISLVHLANRNFRFPLSVSGSATAVSSITVFLMAVPYALSRDTIRTPEFWFIGVGLGTFLCQWMILKTVRHELPKVIEVRARKAQVAPRLLSEFISKPKSWQFELRDMLLATVWLSVLFAVLRALRLANVYLETYAVISLLFHVPMCWFMSWRYQQCDQFGK